MWQRTGLIVRAQCRSYPSGVTPHYDRIGMRAATSMWKFGQTGRKKATDDRRWMRAKERNQSAEELVSHFGLPVRSTTTRRRADLTRRLGLHSSRLDLSQVLRREDRGRVLPSFALTGLDY